MDDLVFRSATPRDSTAIARLIRKSTASYADFAPPTWNQRAPFREEAEVHDSLSRGDTHARLALTPADNVPVGFAGWRPATTQDAAAEPIPGRAHIFALFVVPEHWGAGVASALHDWLLTTIRDCGYREAQLWTPRDQARARAFYDRAGWTENQARATFEPKLGLDLVLYERKLSD